MLLDSRGRPIRRRIGFVAGYDPEPEERPEVSLIACEQIERETIEEEPE